MSEEIIPIQRIENKIHVIRGKRVMMDFDLADLYGVETKVLNQSVRRNLDRFPVDFMFKLSEQEFDILRSQIVTSSLRGQNGTSSWGGTRYVPMVFTEQGVAMLSSVLRSKRAIAVNIQIMRTFTKFREMLQTHEDLRLKLEVMEKRYDEQFKIVFDAIKQLLETDVEEPSQIGYRES
jgi:hypothetical protein